MGTSGSSSPAPRGTAYLYSGRPDPSWSLVAASVSELLALIAGAPPAPVRTVAPALGYRGCVLITDEGTWTAFQGRVVVARMGDEEVVLVDQDRAFELALLRSAPAGLIPDFVLRDT